jgi:hypothetical protein
MATNVRRGIYGKLSGDTTLNNLLGAPASGYSKAIYHNEAPTNAAFPFVTFSKSSGVPTYAMTTTSAFENDVWLVKAIDRSTSADVAESIAARLTALLNDASLSISGATLVYLRRESDVEYPEVGDDSVMYKHVGALYRLVTT